MYWPEMPVLWIEAPAGLGKTVLLSQWRKVALFEGAAVAWLSVERATSGRDLLEGLSDALSRASGCDIEAKPRNGRDRIEAILEQWTSFSRQLYLVLDDVDQLEDDDAVALVNHVLCNVPVNARIFLAARSSARLPSLTYLRSHGQAASIQGNDLALTTSETKAILDREFAIDVCPELAQQIHDRVEGWPLGLQLFTLALRSPLKNKRQLAMLKPGCRQTAAPMLDDASRVVGEDLLQAVATQRGGQTRSVLTNLSLVGRFNEQLYETIASRDEAVSMHDLALVLSGDAPSGWFHVRPLVQDCLQSDLAKLPQVDQTKIRAHAAAWLARHGEHEGAVAHACAVGLTDLALDSIEQCIDTVIASGRLEVLEGWLRQIGRERMLDRPQLHFSIGLYDAICRASVEDGVLQSRLRRPVHDRQFDADLVRMLKAYHADDPDEAARAMQRWWNWNDIHAPIVRAAHTNLKNWLQMCGFRGSNGTMVPHSATSAIKAGVPTVAESASYLMSTVHYLEIGQPTLAIELLAPAVPHFDASHGRRSVSASVLAFSLAAAAAEAGRFDIVREALANRLDLAHQCSFPDARAFGLIAASALAEHDGQPHRALDCLESLRGLARDTNLPRIEAMAAAELARCHMLARRVQCCTQIVSEVSGSIALSMSRESLKWPQVWAHVMLAQAYGAVAERHGDSALQRCSELIEFTQVSGYRRIEMEARILKCRAMYDLHGCVEPEFEESMNLIEVLQLTRLKSYAEKIIPFSGSFQYRKAPPMLDVSQDTLHVDVNSSMNPSLAAPSHLTPRQYCVLKLLGLGMSNKEIARSLDIGDGTVKWHIKNMFSSFGVGNRKQLVARVKLLGLMD